VPEAGGIGRDLVAVLGAPTVAAVELWRPGTLFVEAIAAVGDGVAWAAWELAFIVPVAVQRFPSWTNENILGTGSTRFGRALLLAVPGKVCQTHVGIGTDLVAAAAKDGLVEGWAGTGVGCLATIIVQVESGILYETQVVVEALIPVTTFVGVTRGTFAFVFAGGTSWLRIGAGGSATPHVGEARTTLDAGRDIFEPSAAVAIHGVRDVETFVAIIGQPALSLGGTDNKCRDEEVLNDDLHMKRCCYCIGRNCIEETMNVLEKTNNERIG